MNKLRIVFLGTPDFAVPSLDILFKNGYEIAAVVTAPDKPAGRGQELNQSAIKKYASEKKIKVLQPENLKDENFYKELKALNANLQVIVAFRMLPEKIWNLPELGTFNLHASLLPQYRGAAPINRVIMNGEKFTGVTTFFLRHEIDTGNIIKRKQVEIAENETAGELHDKLMFLGAELVLETVKDIESGNVSIISQEKFIDENTELKSAPKIFKEDCRINWKAEINHIHNQIRGLSPYPAAHTEFISPENIRFNVKIFNATIIDKSSTGNLLQIQSDNKSFIHIPVKGGVISLNELQLAGKKKLKTEEFLRGFKIGDNWFVA